MPNVGWGEMIVIVLIALMVFGPAKLPDMMKGLGKGLRAFQDESSKAMDTLRSATEEASSPAGPGVVDRPDGWFEPPAADAETALSGVTLPMPPAPPLPIEAHEDT